MSRKLRYLLIIPLLLFVVLQVTAQNQAIMVKVEGGRRVGFQVDSVLLMADSLQRDSILTARALRDSLQKDSIQKADFLKDSLRKYDRFKLTQDTLKPGSQLLLSFVPGLGQVYNRQAWKAPVFVGAMGGFLAGGIIYGGKYQDTKAEIEFAKDRGYGTDITNSLQKRMYNEQTTSTVFYALSAATYLYSIADATYNYRGDMNHTRKATTLAALFPGAGFFYTRTYWRLPIYYGGFAVMASVIDYNNRHYVRFKAAYDDVMAGREDEFGGRYSADVLKNARNGYRRNRDFGIICTVGVYLLSVIDTYVIATLKNWDVSPDLSGITVEPTLFNERLSEAFDFSAPPSGVGLSLKIPF